MLPCVLFEDEHLLVVNKPAGLNTHAPGPFAGEGLYDWLKHREPRWASLAIIHRLDKETSGVMVFGKTPPANRSLTEQFTRRVIRKTYQLLTDRLVKPGQQVVKSRIIRAGERYVSSPHGEAAETIFSMAADVRRLKSAGTNKNGPPHVGGYEVKAEPLTGRTHQIRVHLAFAGLPVVGDSVYGKPGSDPVRADRQLLHASKLGFNLPDGKRVVFAAALPQDFEAALRELRERERGDG